MKVHDKPLQVAPRNDLLVHHGSVSRSSETIKSKQHYGSSSKSVAFSSTGTGYCGTRSIKMRLTCPDGHQTLEPDHLVSSTQNRWPERPFFRPGVIDPNYDSSSDLRTKCFESSTLLTTPPPRDSVPHFAQTTFPSDSHNLEPQKHKLLHGHHQASSSQYHGERNPNMHMMSPSSSTPRSRSIKIARTKRSEPDFEADSIDRNRSLYDSATWRMYNRITEYRRQHPINYDDLEMDCAGNNIRGKSPVFLPRKESSTLYGPRALNRVLMSVGPVTSREHQLDGEVFDMDL